MQWTAVRDIAKRYIEANPQPEANPQARNLISYRP